MSGKRHHWKASAACGLIALILSGCWDSKDIDNRLMVGAIGLEQPKDTSLRLWLRFPLPKATLGEAGKDFFTVSQDGLTVPDAMNKAKYKLPKALESSTARAILLDEKMAKSGINPYLEFAVRERSVPLDAIVAVVRGNMERIFTSPNPTGELSGIYTKLFFEPYSGGTPRKNKTMLWEVYAKLYNPLHANLIPLLSEGTLNSFIFAGNVILINGKIVGELNKSESLMYEIFTHRFHDAEMALMNRSDVRIVHNHNRIATSFEGDTPVISIDCSLVTTLIDSSQSLHQKIPQIVDDLKAELTELAQSMFEKTQKQGADVFGFGNHFRSRLEPSQYAKWPEMFKKARINVEFHIDMRNTGLQFLER
ncbi:Ger(x)C family spore germination protein [Paenibacillus doosanensis]|uniref:Ger(x)C family spore germination protein n=1 Tax=Paenibacillus doosanensis TaxID=1229154 RepID=UPI00217F9763|nr:Ger(x)C family spore germination protein [Paenibacillus doosanensis]MCS7460586.1 Ger(x)C family spore germination protein [Paenibacillus doosanensis]